jgi:hypothetical protein
MNYPKELFDLNFAFVFKASEILERPWPDLLLDYTHTFRRFRLGAELDPLNSTWLQFLDGVRQADEPAAYAYQFYLKREREAGPLQRELAFGCFSYALERRGSDIVLRIHFANQDIEGTGPLSRERQPERLAELTRMFHHAQQQLPQLCRVLGASWLYNLPGYRRLFPPAFIASLTARTPDFPMLALWGQFLDHHWQVRPDLAKAFLERVEKARTMKDLQGTFPYSILTANAEIETFYAFFGIALA